MGEVMANKKIRESKGIDRHIKDVLRASRRSIEARELEEAGKLKVCVTYMGPKKRARKVCKTLTKKQIAKLVGIPRGFKIARVTHF